MHGDAIEARLRATSIFREAAADDLMTIARETTIRRIDEGQSLWRAGDAATHFAIVTRGIVHVVRRHPNREASTVGIFVAREWVGTVAVLQRKPFPAEAVASTEVVELMWIRAEPVLALMARSPSLVLRFNADLCERAEMLRARIHVLSAGAVPQRIATLFLYLAERLGDVGDDGVTRIPVALSRAGVARLVSARVETVIRVLSEWQKAGWLLTDTTGFDLRDVAALEKISGSE